MRSEGCVLALTVICWVLQKPNTQMLLGDAKTMCAALKSGALQAS